MRSMLLILISTIALFASPKPDGGYASFDAYLEGKVLYDSHKH